MNERLKNNIAILKRHNLTHEPVYHITDGKKHEIELIDEIVKDCEKIIKDEEQGLIVRLPHKIGEEVTFLDRFCLNYGLYGRAIKTGTIAEIGFTITKEGQRTWQYVIECYDKVYKENDIKSRYFCSQENLCTSKEEAEKKLKELKGKE